MPSHDHPHSNDSIDSLHGIGPQLAEKLARLDIHRMEDLLWHLPLRYRDLTRITPIGALALHSEALVEGTIRACDVVFGRRRSLLCLIQDGTGVLALRFFHFSRAQQQQMLPGKKVRAWGEARRGGSGFEMYHPEYRLLEPGDMPLLADRLTPVYPATEGLQQTRLRKLIGQVLESAAGNVVSDWLPPALLPARLSMPLHEALSYLHLPPADAPVAELMEGNHPAQQRLAFEELVAHHLGLLRLRQQQKRQHADALPQDKNLHRRFLSALPFVLTAAQLRVSEDIACDLQKPEPMLRLVQGDVGSGKTVVAALACMQTVANGKQAAMMAPTEILAEQHFLQFQRWFEPLGFHVVWLSGSVKTKARRDVLEKIANGTAHIAVGTHALFQDEVQFQDLSLVVTDEQHRFGVRQRLALQQKGFQADTKVPSLPHQLVMTATPIPRTLAMSAYADLDCSVIDERPPGRTPVQTVVVDGQRRDEIIERLRAACREGRQVYWVCTLIEESETLQCQAAEVTAATLRAALLDIAVGLVHGKQKPAEKAAVMDAFKRAELHVLVATTVIEVGVDVPNASLMIIENPERLGLAQLHQLRGRVGRGTAASHCVLLYGAPLSRHARERLAILRDSDDGFVIAEKDLELRGPGELLGTRQTGDMVFRIADLARDAHWLPQVKQCAEILLQEQPENTDQ
ncbi:MAG TPA: ATP-dependent DNA helicase RecG, partial [Pseudomonadales bacterium]|nr:ATP-dependent DNA helicase RecG [Pseudomonadales bacterium]